MRPTRDQFFLELARVVATRSTCVRRAVGCVLVDQHGHVMSTGYNGVARGEPHCNGVGPDIVNLSNGMGEDWDHHYPHACAGALDAPGKGLDRCLAIHAEQNALLQCPDVEGIVTAYTTVTPCIHCAKLLRNTGCQRIVAASWYPDREGADYWRETGRELSVLEHSNLT